MWKYWRAADHRENPDAGFAQGERCQGMKEKEKCNPCKISVAMGIYNGEQYIEEQLASILRQTRPAEEVILCDDGSTDKTVSIVQNFIAANGLEENWHLIQNPENKGYPANFYYAMSLCTGEFVFLADQDDIWAETKVEKMTALLEADNEIAVLACRFDLIDGQGNQIKPLMKPTYAKEKEGLEKISIHDIFYRYEWPGMVLAYRNQWYQNWKKTFGTIPHDIFLCAKAAEEGAFFRTEEILAWHRRHENNTAAEEHRIKKLLHKERKLWEIEKYLNMLEQFKECRVLETQEGRRTLEEKAKAMHSRYQALQSGSLIQVIKSAAGNRKNVRLATVVCDMLIVKQ